MSPRRSSSRATLLELWRPPEDAGAALGCLATSYTFHPALFDEQCLARFLEIESEPDREDLAFLLDREHRLGTTYAGVIVDHTQAGVEHSFRWDILPARIPLGKQHAKLSLLMWDRCIRLIVSSANLTEQGYRYNQEVAGQLDFTPESSDHESLTETTGFLRRLLRYVPASSELPSVGRALAFLDDAERRARRWPPPARSTTNQRLVFTIPAEGPGRPSRSALDEALEACRSKGGAPDTAWVASPFYDDDDSAAELTEGLCRAMSRSRRRDLYIAVPTLRDESTDAVRVLAPKTLLTTPDRLGAAVVIESLPTTDDDKNPRTWHAKMLGFRHANYSALLVGSSNFTLAGMGRSRRRNAEANLLTIVRYERFARDERQLESIWPEMAALPDGTKVEWCGARAETEEEEQAAAIALPIGFLSAVYSGGDRRTITLHLEPGGLPNRWSILACGRDQREVLQSRAWKEAGSKALAKLTWSPIEPPERLLIKWGRKEAFMPLNVEDRTELPPPVQVGSMTADDVLGVLAAADPSAAFRAWARTQRSSDLEDDELDSALPIDLDPLRRYDLQTTFLHKVRKRARVLAQLRSNLERPVSSQQALGWRLRGMVGVEVLADRLFDELAKAADVAEPLLTLADLLIVLREVDYRPAQSGVLKRDEFDAVYVPFLRALADDLRKKVEPYQGRVAPELWAFWQRVTPRGRA